MVYGATWVADSIDLALSPLFFVAAISFLDDMKNLPALLRLVVHGAAALMLVSSGVTLLGIMGAVISWFAIIWMMNLYNFMDGMDGLAGGMTLFGFGFLGMAAWLSGHTEYAQLAWAVAAAALSFLMLNLPPSRIFMGDIGAITLGMLAAVFSLWGVHDGLFPIWFPVLVFSPFIVDATITLMQRVLRHKKIWQAHREHVYQKLVLAGWPPRKVLLFEYILMFSSGMTGIWLLGATVFWQVTALSIWVMIYSLLIFAQTREAL